MACRFSWFISFVFRLLVMLKKGLCCGGQLCKNAAALLTAVMGEPGVWCNHPPPLDPTLLLAISTGQLSSSLFYLLVSFFPCCLFSTLRVWKGWRFFSLLQRQQFHHHHHCSPGSVLGAFYPLSPCCSELSTAPGPHCWRGSSEADAALQYHT
jgi:hypothetical protein